MYTVIFADNDYSTFFIESKSGSFIPSKNNDFKNQSPEQNSSTHFYRIDNEVRFIKENEKQKYFDKLEKFMKKHDHNLNRIVVLSPDLVKELTSLNKLLVELAFVRLLNL